MSFLAPKRAQEMQMSYVCPSVLPHYALKLFKAPQNPQEPPKQSPKEEPPKEKPYKKSLKKEPYRRTPFRSQSTSCVCFIDQVILDFSVYLSLFCNSKIYARRDDD